MQNVKRCITKFKYIGNSLMTINDDWRCTGFVFRLHSNETMYIMQPLIKDGPIYGFTNIYPILVNKQELMSEFKVVGEDDNFFAK